MGLLDRLFGRQERRPDRDEGPYRDAGHRGAEPYGGAPAYDPTPGGPSPYGATPPYGTPSAANEAASTGGPGAADARAVERYRYLLRTAPPETVEQAHAEAFAQLTPAQRRQVLEQLAAEVPAAERATSDDPRSLARMATRAEMRRPGTLERSFGGVGMGGVGMGGLVAGTLLSTIAGAFIGTAIADAMFDMSDAGDAGVADDGSADAGTDAGDAGGDTWADGGGDAGGWGDGGGGDFGGGDFGGGDFGGDMGI